MKLINESQYPTKELIKLSHCIRGVKKADVTVTIKNHKRFEYSGCAYVGEENYKNKFYKATVKIGSRDKFPCYGHLIDGVDLTRFKYNNWKEVFVGILAHELWHVHQARLKRPLHETEANLFEFKSLECYRTKQRGNKNESQVHRPVYST